MFLGVTPTVANWSPKCDEFSLILDQNPLVDFVELPDDHQGLLYSNIICGVVRGALEMVCMWAVSLVPNVPKMIEVDSQCKQY